MYAGHPHMDWLEDGRLALGTRVQPYGDHGPVAEFPAYVSEDEGHTWTETDDPTVPYNWPATNNREKLDRWCGVMKDGSWLCAGSIGHSEWSADRRGEAEKLGLQIRQYPNDDSRIMVGGHKMFSQRSTDKGKSWERHEWTIPGVFSIASFGGPRTALLEDGTVLIPTYAFDLEFGHNFVWRSSDHGVTWRLVPTGIVQRGLNPNETTILEVSPGRVLQHSRTEKDVLGYLLERWSDDGGLTWSHLAQTDILGFPAHMLKLRDGRILCAYGYRWEPMGVRAVVSHDGGETWDMDNMVVLHDDGSTQGSLRTYNIDPYTGGDVGYPVSVQLEDGSIYTAYYTTDHDGVTYVAGVHWEV